MAQRKAKAALTPEQETEGLQREMLEMLSVIARKGGAGAVHAIDLIGRLKTNSWWTRPEPAEAPQQLSEKAIQLLLSLPDNCPRCNWPDGEVASHPAECACLDCMRIRQDRKLAAANSEPQLPPVNLADCPTLGATDV